MRIARHRHEPQVTPESGASTGQRDPAVTVPFGGRDDRRRPTRRTGPCPTSRRTRRAGRAGPVRMASRSTDPPGQARRCTSRPATTVARQRPSSAKTARSARPPTARAGRAYRVEDGDVVAGRRGAYRRVGEVCGERPRRRRPATARAPVRAGWGPVAAARRAPAPARACRATAAPAPPGTPGVSSPTGADRLDPVTVDQHRPARQRPAAPGADVSDNASSSPGADWSDDARRRPRQAGVAATSPETGTARPESAASRDVARPAARRRQGSSRRVPDSLSWLRRSRAAVCRVRTVSRRAGRGPGASR